uniref:Putative secreted protein n=1 Tax=Ixodes ricinus TaxID=34613 RepID=A0A147BDP0_IXORI
MPFRSWVLAVSPPPEISWCAALLSASSARQPAALRTAGATRWPRMPYCPLHWNTGWSDSCKLAFATGQPRQETRAESRCYRSCSTGSGTVSRRSRSPSTHCTYHCLTARVETWRKAASSWHLTWKS